MLNSYVDSFGDDSISDLFVDNDSDGSGVHVEYGSGSAMIILVWHAFMDGSVDYDVNNISIFVGSESLGDVNRSVLFESLSELVSSSSFISVAVGHGL
jgi:hypothetical protein